MHLILHQVSFEEKAFTTVHIHCDRVQVANFQLATGAQRAAGFFVLYAGSHMKLVKKLRGFVDRWRNAPHAYTHMVVVRVPDCWSLNVMPPQLFPKNYKILSYDFSRSTKRLHVWVYIFVSFLSLCRRYTFKMNENEKRSPQSALARKGFSNFNIYALYKIHIEI